MTRRAFCLALAVVALACRGPRHERPVGSCTHLQSTRQVRGVSLCEDAWSCQRPPGGMLDRVALHRLALCDAAAGPVVLYLPGMHMNAELNGNDPQHDLRLFLALEGVRTWGLDYRTHAVPANATPGDLEVLGSWTPSVFLDDVAWAAGFVRGAERAPLRLAGFSQGAALAYALAARGDQPVAGLVVLDGAAASGSAAEPGAAAIDVGGSRLPYDARQRLLTDAVADPTAASPLPGFASAGAALADVLYTAPSFGGHGGLANVRDGVSDVQTVAAMLLTYDRWWPRALLSAPAPKPPAKPIPLLAFASTNMGPAWVERVRASAREFGGPGAQVQELPRYGHLDVLAARRAFRDVYQPTLDWLAGQLGSPL